MSRPYRPVRELEAHLQRGELDFALALARGVAQERERPLELELTIRFLPLIAVQRPELFDGWALRWMERWCAEMRPTATIDDAADVVGGLAEIPVDPDHAFETIRAVAQRVSRVSRPPSDT